jgi:hypothetical protein
MTSAEMSNDLDFKFTCDECGAMGIKGFDAAHTDPSTLIVCAKCDCPRGTFAALQALAQFGNAAEFEV